MFSYAFLTVTDYNFWVGTVATVNSILEFHPNATLIVVENEKNALSKPQADFFELSRNVRLVKSSDLDRPGRFINAWELKAHAASDFSEEFDVLIGIDSDCLLCSAVDDEIRRCYENGLFMGGQDGSGVTYDATYAIYGISPGSSGKYMSTSCYVVGCTRANRQTLKTWSECCNLAVFNGQGSYPGHGDQGVLNAVLFAEDESARVELLSNDLWSQHWKYWDTIVDFDGGKFVNVNAGRGSQRTFHCGGAEKFWLKPHSDKVLEKQSLQTYPYVWFLSVFWFGKCRIWDIDPYQYLPPDSHHLVRDLHVFAQQIFAINPSSREMWNKLSEQIIYRALDGIPRMLSPCGGSMTDLVQLVASLPSARRYVEIGGYLGGSLLTLGLRFANRDIDFYSVESFLGNLDGTVDGRNLPVRTEFTNNLAKFPALRVNLVACDSQLCTDAFADESIDLLFIDGQHDTVSVLRDIDNWLPKVTKGGIIAGDDYGWDSVRIAVKQRFGTVNVTPSGGLWWIRIRG